MQDHKNLEENMKVTFSIIYVASGFQDKTSK